MLAPNDIVLNMTHKTSSYSGTTSTHIHTPQVPTLNGEWPYMRGGTGFLSFQVGGFLFSCCGASWMTGMGTPFADEKQKQSFMYKLYNSIEFGQTYYMIADSSQITKVKAYKFGTTLSVLQELGATEHASHKNRNHGPHYMHLFVWVPPESNSDAWKKFLHCNQWGNPDAPLWWSELPETAQKRLLEESVPLYEKMQANEIKQKENEATNKRNGQMYAAQSLISQGFLTDFLKGQGWVKQDEKVRDLGSQPAEILDGTGLSFKRGS